MGATYKTDYERGANFVQHLDGVPWFEADPPPRRHVCWPQTRGLLNGVYVERCACGSTGPDPFVMIGRKPRVQPRRSISAFLCHR